MHTSLARASTLVLATLAVAQIGGNGADGPLLVTQGTVILDTTARPSGFDYTWITIAAGAEVRLSGTNPARLRSQGPVTIDGWLNADGFATTTSAGGLGGPGGFDGGIGGRGMGGLGQGPGGGCAGWSSAGGTLFGYPGPASHATAARAASWCGQTFGGPPPIYGTAWPFDTRGGSGSGGNGAPLSWGVPGVGGAGGGGTIVLAADGPVVVRGRISVKPPAGAAPASSGSILIQTTATLRIDGSVDASDTPGSVMPFTFGGAGFLRFDTHGEPATIVGTVAPAPMPVVLPRFRDVDAPRVGAPFVVRMDAWPNDILAVWLSGRATSLPFPPLGILRLDPTAGLALLGVAATTASATGLEATASLAVPVPTDPRLRGVTLHLQTLNVITRAPTPRFSELLTATIQ